MEEDPVADTFSTSESIPQHQPVKAEDQDDVVAAVVLHLYTTQRPFSLL